jgi:hypothetical protein
VMAVAAGIDLLLLWPLLLTAFDKLLFAALGRVLGEVFGVGASARPRVVDRGGHVAPSRRVGNKKTT